MTGQPYSLTLEKGKEVLIRERICRTIPCRSKQVWDEFMTTSEMSVFVASLSGFL